MRLIAMAAGFGDTLRRRVKLGLIETTLPAQDYTVTRS